MRQAIINLKATQSRQNAETIVVRGKRVTLEAYIVNQLSDADQTFVADYLNAKKGKEKSFSVDGVMMRLENHEEIAIPLFLFSDKERTVLEEGWDTWQAESTKEDDRNRESFLAEASASEYQRNLEAEARINQQIQMMQLGLMAVNAGITNVWQVQLLPRPGV